MLAHANTRIERLHRERTGLTRSRLAVLVAIRAHQLTRYGYGPSFEWIATFCTEKLSMRSPFVLHELRRQGLVMRGEGLVVLGYVLTERGEERLAGLMGWEGMAAE